MARLPWPGPALLAWALTWGVFRTLDQWASWPAPLPVVLACLLGIGLSVLGTNWWRRAMIAAGFPVALLVSGAAGLPAWGWLVLLVLLLLVYPLNAWRDAPLFPTPSQALQALATSAPLPPDAVVLDAGCGLGHGLQALRQAYPHAQLQGLEWSWPLRALCALRCPWARVRQGDLWRADWSHCALVYLFQRPESMPRAAAKAAAELRPGAWLVSLEFEARELVPHAVLTVPDGRPLWLYCQPFVMRGADAPSHPAKRGRAGATRRNIGALTTIAE